MRKFNLNSIKFLLLLFVVLVLVEWRLSENLQTHIDLKYSEVYNAKVSAKIVILGNSHAAFAVDPIYIEKQTGLSTYNFAMGGGTPLYYRIWYEEVFRKHYQKPDYVVYSVDYAMFDTSWGMRNFDTDIRLVDFQTWVNVLLTEQNVGKKDAFFNRFYILNKPKQLQYLLKTKKDENLDNYYNGFVARKGDWNPDFQELREVEMSSIMRSEFCKLVDLLHQDSIRIIFVSTPELKKNDPVEGYNSYLKFIQNVSSNYNIPVLDYNNERELRINSDTSYYFDWVHLNNKGAQFFSDTLGKDLNQYFKNGI